MNRQIDRHLFTEEKMSRWEVAAWGVLALVFTATCLVLMLAYFDVLVP
jgi:hypothetical protein